ncbi:MAG: 3-oxoacyl-[acyl-carrier-protein] synthase II [Chloroflexi bacterium]|nr:MAG: 3-oxoacyl-[acyl-carrier-protein] synthase II [Chloroflexota bacterium]
MPAESAPDEERRVVITGVGAIAAAGADAPAVWDALLAGRSALTPLPPGLLPRPALAGQIENYPGPAGVPADFAARLSRASQFALDAAIQAIADARIAFTAENAYSVASLVGAAHGADPAGPAAPLFSAGLAGASTGLNIAGPSYAINAGAASGLVAMLQAAAMIRAGDVHAALAGGAEAPLRPEIIAAYDSLHLLSSQATPNALRPFDLLRDGTVLGEGAAIFLLEDRELAVQRGARVYGEILGGAVTAGPAGDGAPPTDVDIARQAIGRTLRTAGRSPQEVDLVFTAGGGTQAGDARETDILERSFGTRILDMYVTATTPVLGHTIGASGPLATLAALFALAQQTVPPHPTYADPDPDCALDITVRPQTDHLHSALISAYGSAGQNAAMLIAPHRAERGDELPVVL